VNCRRDHAQCYYTRSGMQEAHHATTGMRGPNNGAGKPEKYRQRNATRFTMPYIQYHVLHSTALQCGCMITHVQIFNGRIQRQEEWEKLSRVQARGTSSRTSIRSRASACKYDRKCREIYNALYITSCNLQLFSHYCPKQE